MTSCRHCGREIKRTAHPDNSWEDAAGWEVCELTDDNGPNHEPVMKGTNKVIKAALDAAIQEDHPCSDSFGCDIEVARANGYVEAAVTMLTGATETPAVNRVLCYYGLSIGSCHDRAFDRWVAFHRKYGVECPACESFMYTDPDTGDKAGRCTNCHAPMDPTDDFYREVSA